MILSRLVRALLLSGGLYEELRQDESLTGEALLVVALTSAVAGLGSAILALLRGLGFGWFVRNLFLGTLAYILAWLVLAIVCFVAATVLRGQVSATGLVRGLAYSYAPAVGWFLLLIDVSWLQVILSILIFIWLTLSVLNAVRYTLDLDLTQLLIVGGSGAAALILFTIFAVGAMDIGGTWAWSSRWFAVWCARDPARCMDWCSKHTERCQRLLGW